MREVNYLTDKSQDSEKLLSFKEQILRDLEEGQWATTKIEKEYDLSDRSKTFFTERGRKSNTTSKVEESALAPKEEPVEPVRRLLLWKKGWAYKSLLKRTKSGNR